MRLHVLGLVLALCCIVALTSAQITSPIPSYDNSTVACCMGTLCIDCQEQHCLDMNGTILGFGSTCDADRCLCCELHSSSSSSTSSSSSSSQPPATETLTGTLVQTGTETYTFTGTFSNSNGTFTETVSGTRTITETGTGTFTGTFIESTVPPSSTAPQDCEPVCDNSTVCNVTHATCVADPTCNAWLNGSTPPEFCDYLFETLANLNITTEDICEGFGAMKVTTRAGLPCQPPPPTPSPTTPSSTQTPGGGQDSEDDDDTGDVGPWWIALIVAGLLCCLLIIWLAARERKRREEEEENLNRGLVYPPPNFAGSQRQPNVKLRWNQ